MEGDPAERIIAVAEEGEPALIILSSHGKSGLSGWNVSSVVQKVILRANTSVMIVPAYRRTNVPVGELEYQRVLIPLDGSRRAEVVLPYVRSLVEGHDSEPLIVTVISRPEMPRRAPLSPEDAALAEQVVERNREAAEKYLTDLVARLGEQCETRLLIGDSVIGRLQNFLEEEPADLVVFSAHGYSGDRNRPYGSLVTSFIAYGRSPMLIIQDVPREELRASYASELEKFGAEDNESTTESGPRVVHART